MRLDLGSEPLRLWFIKYWMSIVLSSVSLVFTCIINRFFMCSSLTHSLTNGPSCNDMRMVSLAVMANVSAKLGRRGSSLTWMLEGLDSSGSKASDIKVR